MVMLNAVSEIAMNRTATFLSIEQYSYFRKEKYNINQAFIFFFSPLCGATYVQIYLYISMYVTYMFMYAYRNTATYMTKCCISERCCSNILSPKYSFLNRKNSITNLHYRQVLEFKAYW